MEFANDPIARRIREAAGRGPLSHALLFSGSGDRIAVAQYAAAAMECQGGGQKPCGTCPACRKVFSGIHPDVITVRDEAHKNLSVDTVRQIRADAYIRPNEGARKVYIFPDCTILTEQDQNVLLKIVEEGPPYAAFLFRGLSDAPFPVRGAEAPSRRHRGKGKLGGGRGAVPSAGGREEGDCHRADGPS